MAGRAAVFLDRDGVLIREVGHLTRTEQVELIAGAADALKLLNRSFPVVVVSNQAAVARGMMGEGDVVRINSFIRALFKKEGAMIDAFYFCPHHPGYTGKCGCRKPGTGMLMQAEKGLGLDLKRSFIVGDKTSDIKAGKDAGCTAILVRTGYGGSDCQFRVHPDFTEPDMMHAAKRIISISGKK